MKGDQNASRKLTRMAVEIPLAPWAQPLTV